MASGHRFVQAPALGPPTSNREMRGGELLEEGWEIRRRIPSYIHYGRSVECFELRVIDYGDSVHWKIGGRLKGHEVYACGELRGEGALKLAADEAAFAVPDLIAGGWVPFPA